MELLRPDVLVIDDDAELAGMLREFLDRDGFRTRTAADGDSGLRLLAQERADLVVLDVMLPGRHGFDVLRELRAQPRPPAVLMLTARGDAVDRILGLELGADDYLPKPFDPRELAARLQAILRRATSGVAAPDTDDGPSTLHCGDLELDPATRSASVHGQALELTLAEFRVLLRLAQQPAAAVSREELTEFALGRQMSLYDRSIDTHVSNLRRKLAAHGGASIEIRAVRGAGYELLVLAKPGTGA